MRWLFGFFQVRLEFFYIDPNVIIFMQGDKLTVAIQPWRELCFVQAPDSGAESSLGLWRRVTSGP